MRGVSAILSRLAGGVSRRPSFLFGGAVADALMMSSFAAVSYSYASSVILSDLPQTLSHYSTPTFVPANFIRNFSSSSGPSNVVLIESEEQFTNSLRKVQDESLPAIFYFTAAWCGPCRLLSPVIGQLSEKYPHVTTYKIDIDQEKIGSALSKLNIHSVPTLHFFQNGKKASEMIGADVQHLNDMMEKLYKL